MVAMVWAPGVLFERMIAIVAMVFRQSCSGSEISFGFLRPGKLGRSMPA
jgi:hypothetical protein